MSFRSTFVIAALLWVVACDRAPEPGQNPIRSAEFGIFFGGQIQERKEVPFELDPVKQTQGFRIELREPSDREQVIEWEVARPSGSAKGPKRVAAVGRGTLSRGQRVFERTLPFSPGDPIGLWNVRVVMGDRVLLDRPFVVYDRAARAKQRPDAGTTIP